MWPRCVCACAWATTVSSLNNYFVLSPSLSISYKSSEILFTSFFILSIILFPLIKNVMNIRTGNSWFSHSCGTNHGRFSRSDIEFKQGKLCRRTRTNLESNRWNAQQTKNLATIIRGEIWIISLFFVIRNLFFVWICRIINLFNFSLNYVNVDIISYFQFQIPGTTRCYCFGIGGSMLIGRRRKSSLGNIDGYYLSRHIYENWWKNTLLAPQISHVKFSSLFWIFSFWNSL